MAASRRFAPSFNESAAKVPRMISDSLTRKSRWALAPFYLGLALSLLAPIQHPSERRSGTASR
jgi:hypothetical protein